MKNKNLILFIVIGFIVTTALWGFVGGCGTSNVSLKTEPKDIAEEIPGVVIPKEGESYIVEPGDTLWKISKKFDVPITDIKSANKLETDAISVGQRLFIPGVQIPKTQVKDVRPPPVKEVKEGGQTSIKQEVQKPQITQKPGTAVYKVRKDDSLWRIAQSYGTTIEHIAELNGLSKNARLTPGQEILVPALTNEPR